jgi:hypothetical protein
MKCVGLIDLSLSKQWRVSVVAVLHDHWHDPEIRRSSYLVCGSSQGVTDHGRSAASGAAWHRDVAPSHVGIDRCRVSIQPTLDPRIDPKTLRLRPRLSIQARVLPAPTYQFRN